MHAHIKREAEIYTNRFFVHVRLGVGAGDLELTPSGVLRGDVRLKVRWNEFRFMWDPVDYGNITVVRIPADRFWMPDIFLLNE